MKTPLFHGVFSILAGIFTIFCAAMNFDWFMNHHRARTFVNIFGREGARVFYLILGIFLMILGTSIIGSNFR